MIDNSKKHPSHIAYQVQDKDKGGKWNRIGAAWATKDQDGYVIHLDALPLNGRVVLRTNDQK